MMKMMLKSLRAKIVEAEMPQEAQDVANKELRRLVKMNPSSAEYTVARTYIDWLISLPWSVTTDDSLDISLFQKSLTKTIWPKRSKKES